MNENKLRDEIARLGESLFARGLTFGASGNLSARVDDGVLITPTGSSMGNLDPAKIAKLDEQGRHVSGDKPSKEMFLHSNVYAARPKARAIAHLHATHSVAVSCMEGIDPRDVLPPLTAYYVMRVGRLPLLPYFAPGDKALAAAVKAMAAEHHAMLLANHGPITAGKSVFDAACAMEELEETAKLFLLLQGHSIRPLDEGQTARLRELFPIET